MKNPLYRILIVLCAVWWTAAPAVAETNPQKVIVFPLYGTPESESVDWVGEGIAASLAKQLRYPMVNVMDGALVAELLEDSGFVRGVQPSRASMINIAQKASADVAIMGSFEGTERNLSVSVMVLYLDALRLSGNISANGPLAALPQVENELAWQVLTEIGIEKSVSRENHYKRTRQIPNSAFALYIQSFGAAGENHRQRLLLKALDSFSAFPEAQFQLGMHYYRKNDCKSALKNLLAADSDDNFPAAGIFTIATCYLKTGQLPLAMDAYSRILQDSRPFAVLNNLGIAHLRQGENLAALKYFEEAHSLAPDESAISLNTATAMQIQGYSSRARNIVEEAIEADPQNGMLQLLLGFLLREQGEEEAAERAFQGAANLGIHTKQLLDQDPKTWLQLYKDVKGIKSKV
jgi:Tfp pilus assembly protein PilF